MNIKQKFGKKIREIRIKRSLTQEMLAEKLNISSKSLSQIELGNNFVSAETLDNLCNTLNILPNQLFNFDSDGVNDNNMLEELIKKLSNDRYLLKTIYKIALILEN